VRQFSLGGGQMRLIDVRNQSATIRARNEVDYREALKVAEHMVVNNQWCVIASEMPDTFEIVLTTNHYAGWRKEWPDTYMESKQALRRLVNA
jgi:hypothetical protein